MKRAGFLIILLLSVGRCSDDGGQFPRSARYTPTVLDFGEVPWTSLRTMTVMVSSDGGSAVSVVGATIDGDGAMWRVDAAPTEPLAPGETSAIDVTYRACPDAWDGEVLRAGFDGRLCPTEPAAATLVIVDDSADGGVRIELLALPVSPPKARVMCPTDGEGLACGVPTPARRLCGQLDYGREGITMCDLFVEIHADTGTGRTGALEIVGASVVLRELDDPNQVLVAGGTLGFSVRNADGGLVTPSRAFPLRIEVGTSLELHVVATEVVGGTWVGIPAEGGGLRLETNDPTQPVIAVQMFAAGADPLMSASPARLEFEPRVGQQTRRVTVRSGLEARSTIEQIEIEPALFTWSASRDPVGVLDSPLDIDVVYDGPDDMLRTGTLRIVAPDQTLEVPLNVTFGDRDRCAVDTTLLSFQTAGEPARAVAMVSADSVFGCRIVSLDITGSGTDDFSVDLPECATLPCTLPDVRLAAGESFAIPIVYQNDDTSTVDAANLEITTRDTPDAMKIVGLNAMDDPCLPPSPVIMVTTESPCVGEAVQITAASSLVGGRSTGATIMRFDWVVRFGEQVVFVPPNTETTTFTPTMSRDLHVGLELENSCGGLSTSSAVEVVAVAPNCE